VQTLVRRELHAPRLGDGDEIAEMPQLHGSAIYLPSISIQPTKLFSAPSGGARDPGERETFRAARAV
jgi:hypothetical protein